MAVEKKRIGKNKHPRFRVSNYGRSKRKRVKKRWRAPRGIDSKQRKKIKPRGNIPSIGYGSPRSIRGLHPSGMEEMLVNTVGMLQEAAGKVVRISAAVGRRKKEEIRKKANEMGLRVLN
jgi:large subunit ribosomal protein L32e